MAFGNDFALWWRLEKDDIQWLREYFLRCLEMVLLSIYTGAVEMPEGDKSYTDFDGGDCDSLNVGNSNEGEDEEVFLQWLPRKSGPMASWRWILLARSWRAKTIGYWWRSRNHLAGQGRLPKPGTGQGRYRFGRDSTTSTMLGRNRRHGAS